MRKIEYIHISALHPHPDNPRRDLGDLSELADSIKAKGILQNLTVVPDKVDGGYRIIIGHRRHAAAQLAGVTDLPCVIADMTPQEQFETMMVENVQRSDLTVYEQAEGFQMMLDMGATVEEVAQKTGFSETTVRNRVKLMRLDKDKFKKAEQRGATLSDYLKLNEIKDPQRRNSVLDTIGTPNFHSSLKVALDDQKYQEEFEAALEYVKNASWLKEKTDEDTSYKGDYDTWRYFDRWNRKPITMPTDLDKATYIYYVFPSNKEFHIYRKGPSKNGKKGLTPEEEKKARYRKMSERIEKQLGQLNRLHREMREEFVQNFTAFNNNQLDIEAFAARALIAYTYGSGDIELLGKITGIHFDLKKHPRDSEMWNKMLFNQPLRALLLATYAKIEKIGTKYYTTQWQDKMGMSVPRHEKEDLLDILYEGLVSLGYEMSDDEIQMQDGTHPLFKEAKDLITAFKKEKV